MRLRTLVRVAPGAWLTPIMIALVGLYVSQEITFAPRNPYPLGLTARAMNVLGLVVPIVAGAAAWEGARLRRAEVWTVPTVRRRLVIATWSITPALVGGGLVLTAAAIQVLAHEGLWLPDPIVMLPMLAVTASHALGGFAAGVWLPRAVAVPAAVLGSFSIFVLPRIDGPRWLRQLTGTSIELCCSSEYVLAPAVLVGVLVASLGIATAAAVLIVRQGSRPVSLVLAGASLAAAVAIGAMLIGDRLGPEDLRSERASACQGTDRVTVCVWPEHRHYLDRAVRVASDTVRIWGVFGIAAPSVFREGPANKGEASIRVGPGGAGIISQLSNAMLPSGPPACAAREPWRSAIAAPYIKVWLESVAGMPKEWLAWEWEDTIPNPVEYPDTPVREIRPVLPLVSAVLELPPDEQGAWFRENLAALGQCDMTAPLQPG
jgi:hypothetical protein